MTDTRKTVETDEIAFFDRYYEGHAYNPLGWRLRLQREVRSLLGVEPKRSVGRVLSLGCGDGQFEVILAPFAERILAIDISPMAIQAAQNRAGHAGVTNVDFCCLSLADLEWNERFDTIVCLAFLHHVAPADLPLLLKKCFAHLADGGCFYSQDPNRRGFLRAIGRITMGAAYDRFHSANERELEPDQLADELRSVGFREVRLGYIDVTLIPALFLLAKGPNWPLHLCAVVDAVWCASPLARWASGFMAVARK